jgi:phage terminase large subunit
VNAKIVTTGYNPRPLQARIHRELKRFNVIVCHRRFGKTHLVLNEMIDQGLRCTHRNPQYAYIAPTYGQAKRVAWDILKDYLKNIPGVEINESELRIDIPRPHLGDRVRFILLGAENPGSIRGIYLNGVILDEFAEMNPEIWTQVIRPALSDYKGWGIFIGTPKGQNHFYEIYQSAKANPDWYTALFKASETGIIDQGELDAAKATMAENEYEQEFECSFSAALVGAFYGREMEKAEKEDRIGGVPYDRILPVVTGWDLGIDDTTVIWFAQVRHREVRLIDYIEEGGQGLDYYVKEITKRGYNYSYHILPHDVNVRELTTGKSRLESLRSMGLKNVRVADKLSLEDGINAARLLIGKSYFDAERCKRGIEALKSYERKWDAKNKIMQQRPLHNWASHGADAFRSLAVGLREDTANDDVRRKYPRTSNIDYSVV